eukprot:3270833-Rhodomonas_salina.1
MLLHTDPRHHFAHSAQHPPHQLRAPAAVATAAKSITRTTHFPALVPTSSSSHTKRTLHPSPILHSIASSQPLLPRYSVARGGGGSTEKILLAGHSMGGLVARMAVAEEGGCDLGGAHVMGILTVTTPHLRLPAVVDPLMRSLMERSALVHTRPEITYESPEITYESPEIPYESPEMTYESSEGRCKRKPPRNQMREHAEI